MKLSVLLFAFATSLGIGVGVGLLRNHFFSDDGDLSRMNLSEGESHRNRKARSFRYRAGGLTKSEYSRSYIGTAAAYISHLSELSIDQFADEADYLFEFQDPDGDKLFDETPYLFFAAWGSLDPEAALNYSKRMDLARRYDSVIFQGWVSTDPDGFLEYYRSNAARVEWEGSLPAGSALSYGYTCSVPAISNELKRSYPELVDYWEDRANWRTPTKYLRSFCPE